MNFPLGDYKKRPVEEYPNQATHKNPFVSICVQTYNQRNYIRDCLEGILMQNTYHSYEILLGEDESQDGTREICQEYARKHPDKIRLFLHSRKNNIPLNGKPSGRFNFLYNLYQARGKYVAFCEGDDYWTDPQKLEKQISLLRKYPEMGMVYTGFKRYFQKSGKTKSFCFHDAPPEKLQGNIFQQLLINNWIATASVMVKKQSIDQYVDPKLLAFQKFLMADYPIWLEVAYHQKIGFIREPMVVNRVLKNSTSQSQSARQRADFLESKYQIQKYFIRKYQIDQEISDAIDLAMYRKRLQYAFFLDDATLSQNALKNLKDLRHRLTLKEKIYHHSLKNKWIHQLLKRLFISLNIWI